MSWFRTALVLFFFTFSSLSYGDETVSSTKLSHLIKHDCGSCHGMTLKGGLGPSLLTDTLRHWNAESLFYVIKEGKPGTAMPAWKTLLSDDEIRWIAAQLKQGFEE